MTDNRRRLVVILTSLSLSVHLAWQSAHAQGLTYFVARIGCSDSYPGTLAQPFCTIPKGMEVVRPGDALVLRAGTYPGFTINKSGTSTSPITIRPYANEHVIIAGGSSAIFFSGASYVVIERLEVTGATGSYGAGILIKNGSNNNRIEACLIHDNRGSKTHGVIIDGSSHNSIVNNSVYDNFSVGLKVQGGSTGNRLIGNTVHHHNGDPPNSDGIAVSGENTSHTWIQDNVVYDNSDDGIDTWSSHHNTLIGNVVYNSGVGGGDGNGFKLGGTSTGGSNTVIGNISYNNRRDGYDSNHSGNNTYINNLAFNNASVGYQDGEGKIPPCDPSTCRTTFINNIGYNNKAGNFNASEYTYVSHNNLWYSDGGSPRVSYKGTQYSSLASFFNATGNRLDNPNAGVLSSLSANPQFVGASGGDFRLSPSSPAIDAGDPANPGHLPANNRIDIGALEYGGTTPSTPTPEPSFTDVPLSHPYFAQIEALYRAGYTTGCSTNPFMYCPNATMNRAESAVFVERGIHSASYAPPAPSSQAFDDVPLTSWAASWIDAVWQDQFTQGCGTNPLIYCPWQGHTRAEGSVFYLRMLNGPGYAPPSPTQQLFADVPLDAWYAAWMHAAYSTGILPACQASPDIRLCPEGPLSRGLAAYMMVQAKGLPVAP